MVRLWSSWDLSPVRDIPTLQTFAVTAVAFSFDNQVCYSNHPGNRSRQFRYPSTYPIESVRCHRGWRGGNLREVQRQRPGQRPQVCGPYSDPARVKSDMKLHVM